MTENDINLLLDEIISRINNAYTPYSKFNVVSGVIDQNGKKHFGVNVENRSYGLTMCAERNAIAAAVTNGMKTIKVIAVVADTVGPISPCGACREVISEFSSDDTIIILSNKNKVYKQYKISELLPLAFRFDQ
ncbi:MAG: cytidine deaminase [Spirochaetes bacterium]|nr:cytidine deaminase [Spirochaetota bacterium]